MLLSHILRGEVRRCCTTGLLSRTATAIRYTSNLPNLTQEQLTKIGEIDEKLRNRHTILESQLEPEVSDQVRRKRMIYRSKQRGWLEADLLMGSWAVEHVPKLSKEQLDEYEMLLQEETIDIYNYISKKDPLPPHLENLSVIKDIQNYALTKNMASPEGYENVKRKTNLT
mmetsp:Transcript_10570/g.16024  ORF Transcript_10570/g.16024 Transcript_10570/m.16024 type:complete len:170 (+) Transcript_10570:74-583(+)